MSRLSKSAAYYSPVYYGNIVFKILLIAKFGIDLFFLLTNLTACEFF